jgi:hypothetical protein
MESSPAQLTGIRTHMQILRNSTIHLFVKTRAGERITVDVEASESSESIKAKIQVKDIRPDDELIMYRIVRWLTKTSRKSPGSTSSSPPLAPPPAE